jgi:hypothetical protein
MADTYEQMNLSEHTSAYLLPHIFGKDMFVSLDDGENSGESVRQKTLEALGEILYVLLSKGNILIHGIHIMGLGVKEHKDVYGDSRKFYVERIKIFALEIPEGFLDCGIVVDMAKAKEVHRVVAERIMCTVAKASDAYYITEGITDNGEPIPEGLLADWCYEGK